MVEGKAVVCGRGWGCHVVEGGAVWWRAGLLCVMEVMLCLSCSLPPDASCKGAPGRPSTALEVP